MYMSSLHAVSFFPQECDKSDADAACALLNETIGNFTSLKVACETLPQPCRGRGFCNTSASETGVCACEGGWEGPQCDTQPACRYWDEATHEWSTEGTTLVANDGGLDAGFAVCGAALR